MTKEQLEKTRWAKAFKKEDPHNYQFALDYALRKPLHVEIYKESYDGEDFWAISIGSFLMEGKKTEKEALAFCKKMGWKIND